MIDSAAKQPVLIAGGGIGGMTLALTLHQIGVPCVVYEAVADPQPLGVGINLQPNAVRELYDLGIGSEMLDGIGIQAREWALVGRNGNDVYAEARGLLAGYRWPQYSVHRGKLQMLLYRTVLERLGSDAVRLGQRVTGYRERVGGITALIESRDSRQFECKGRLLVAADGLHSAVRAQMYPDQPPIQWGGAIMWRGTTPGVPIRTGASFVGVGSLRHRVVLYPISRPEPSSGLATTTGAAGAAAPGWRPTSPEANTGRVGIAFSSTKVKSPVPDTVAVPPAAQGSALPPARARPAAAGNALPDCRCIQRAAGLVPVQARPWPGGPVPASWPAQRRR